MDPQIKANALEIIKNYRVPDLQVIQKKKIPFPKIPTFISL